MFWHIDTDIVALAVFVVLYIYNRTIPLQHGFELRNRRYIGCLQAGLVITVIDIAASVIMEVPTTRVVYHILMTAYFIAIQAVIVEWFLYGVTILYQNDKVGAKRVNAIIIAGYLLYVIFNILNPWTEMVYSLGPNMEYSRGPYFMMMVLLYSVYVLALFVLVVIRWRKIPAGYPGLCLLLVPIFLAVGIAVQLLVPGWLMIVPAYMVCMVLTNQFLQSITTLDSRVLVQKLSHAAATDPLTGIYNRAGAESQLQSMRDTDEGKNCLVVMVDIDDLKVINDTMGHAQGDRAISSVADKLKSCFCLGDIVSRYGGDEFLIYKPGEMSETQIHIFLKGIGEELSKIRIGVNNDVPVHGSIGATTGIVGIDDFPKLCAQADTALYHVKRSGKNGYAVYRKEMQTASEDMSGNAMKETAS